MCSHNVDTQKAFVHCVYFDVEQVSMVSRNSSGKLHIHCRVEVLKAFVQCSEVVDVDLDSYWC